MKVSFLLTWEGKREMHKQNSLKIVCSEMSLSKGQQYTNKIACIASRIKWKTTQIDLTRRIGGPTGPETMPKVCVVDGLLIPPRQKGLLMNLRLPTYLQNLKIHRKAEDIWLKQACPPNVSFSFNPFPISQQHSLQRIPPIHITQPTYHLGSAPATTPYILSHVTLTGQNILE